MAIFKLRGLSLLFFTCFLNSLAAQTINADAIKRENHVFNDKIKTVQLYKEGWNLSYPIIKLNNGEKLLCNFDLLGDQAETYYYTFIHCDKDWKRSDIFINDFTDGYPENPIEDYQTSFNTTVKYIHYKFSFPNERVSLKFSGNYLLVIYPVDAPDQPVITRRFMVTEDALNIDVSVHRPLMNSSDDAHQQVDFTVEWNVPEFIDPYTNFYAFILQNGRWDNEKRDLKPDFSEVSRLKYNSLSDKNIFAGGNEFRYFDIKSIRYQSEYVRSIDFVNSYYNVFLFPSDNREFKPYFYWQDFNGKYYIAFQEGKHSDIEADYVYVYFTLPSKENIEGGNMYVSGGLNNWNYDSNNLMSYNARLQQYECTMLLKQGWYNYEYVFLKNGSHDGTATLFEGSHYETENDYIVLIYYRKPGGRYDRLTGSVVFNTLNRLTF
jgi:Type 9 secretion system plug protein 1st domain